MAHKHSTRRGLTRQTDPDLAAAELHDALEQPDLQLVVFYCSPDHDLEPLARALRGRFGDATVVGCTTAGEITPEGYLQGTITGFSLGGAEFQVSVATIPLDPFDTRVAEATVEALLGRLERPTEGPATSADTFGLLLIDGLSMVEERVVSALHQRLRGIELIGGSAADATRFGATYVYCDGEFRQSVAALVLVRTSLPFRVFHTQHFEKTDQRMVVTRSDPQMRRVYEIDGLPAAREYARLVGLDVAELTPFIFASHPVVVRVGGQYYVRSIAYVHPDGSLQFFCAIANGIVLTIATGVSMVANLQRAFEDLRSDMGVPQLVLGCDCILRELEIEREGLRPEISRIFKDNNVIGFATYGEQINAMHVNQTFTGIAIGNGADGGG